MSASREKKKRQEQVSAPGASANETAKSNKGLKTLLGVVVALVLVAVVVFFGMVNVGYFEKHTTAVVASGHELSPVMVNYYYGSTFASQNMQQMLQMFADPELPLDEQECPLAQDSTWADYVMDTSLSAAASTYAVYNEAMEKGYELSEEGKASVQTELDTLESMAKVYGYTSGNAFLATQYGKGCTMDTYEEYLTVNFLAQEYTQSVVDAFQYAPEEIASYYAENPELFDGYDFRMFNLKVEKEVEKVEEETEETTEGAKETEEAPEEPKTPAIDPEKLAEVEAITKKIAEESKGDEKAFIAMVKENAPEAEQEKYADDDATLFKDFRASDILEGAREWMLEDGREVGDTIAVPNGTNDGFCVLFYLGENDHSFQLPNIRHILITPTDKEDEASVAEAKAEAEAILAEFEAGEKTDEAFAALATEKTMDPGSKENGGLYENVAPGTMVQEFNDWCFEDGRKTGDTGIVETDYGFHVMYVSGFGMTYQDTLVENMLMQEDYQAWDKAIGENTKLEIVNLKHVTTR